MASAFSNSSHPFTEFPAPARKVKTIPAKVKRAALFDIIEHTLADFSSTPMLFKRIAAPKTTFPAAFMLGNALVQKMLSRQPKYY